MPLLLVADRPGRAGNYAVSVTAAVFWAGPGLRLDLGQRPAVKLSANL